MPAAPARGSSLLLVGLTLVLLAVLPALFLLKDLASDPVYAGLDSLNVPAWAKLAHQDAQTGNRYCVGSCELRERVVQSGRPTEQTDAAYQSALRKAGWTPLTGEKCPTGQPGKYTCWQREQYALDLWARDANCTTSGAGGPTLGPSAVLPSGEAGMGEMGESPASSAAPSSTGPATAACPASQVTIKVGNRADPLWHA
jgi:hypothetical protein